MELSEVVRTKRAIRRFKPDPLPDDAVEAILNAARRSPTSANSQYITYTAIRDKELQAQLGSVRSGTRHLGTAPFVVVIVAQTEQWSAPIVHFDIGQAASYMMLQAWDLGIGSNVAWFGDEDAVRKILNLPDDAQCGWAIAFGYPEEETATSAPMKPGGRKSLDEVVRWGKWS